MSTARALIVDDSEVLRRLIEMCLRPAGFEVFTAANGKEALQVAAEAAPDLVILDIGLPDMTGWEVLEAVRAEAATADAKILILSGYEDAHTEAKKLGADAALVKPFRNDELRSLAVDLAGPRLTEASPA
ncbi:MAG: response regulator [Acidimicrobiia bacterium]|nr:response regulator [Acidimicrobiia bacterium]